MIYRIDNLMKISNQLDKAGLTKNADSMELTFDAQRALIVATLDARQDGRAEFRDDTDPVLRAAWEVLNHVKYVSKEIPENSPACDALDCLFLTLKASTEAQRVKQEMSDEKNM